MIDVGGSDSAGTALVHLAFIVWVLCVAISSACKGRAWVDHLLTVLVSAVGVGLILAVPFGWVERPATGMSGMFFLLAAGVFAFIAQHMRKENRRYNHG